MGGGWGEWRGWIPEVQAIAKGGDLFFMDVTIHISHKDNMVPICLPGEDSNTKILEEGHPGWARVILTK